MYICVCNKVTDREIHSAVEAGLESFDELCSQLRIASCCGRCSDCAQSVLATALRQVHEPPQAAARRGRRAARAAAWAEQKTHAGA